MIPGCYFKQNGSCVKKKLEVKGIFGWIGKDAHKEKDERLAHWKALENVQKAYHFNIFCNLVETS